jgi:hypothetical protein
MYNQRSFYYATIKAIKHEIASLQYIFPAMVQISAQTRPAAADICSLLRGSFHPKHIICPEGVVDDTSLLHVFFLGSRNPWIFLPTSGSPPTRPKMTRTLLLQTGSRPLHQLTNWEIRSNPMLLLTAKVVESGTVNLLTGK